MEWKDIYKEDNMPSLNEISEYINNPLYEDLSDFLKKNYNPKISIEYSKCSSIPGWNIKYKKGSKSLCVIYPNENIPSVMIVIGKKIEAEAESLIYTLSDYVLNIYKKSKSNSGLGTWMVIDLKNKDVLHDFKKLIELKVKI